MQIISCSPVLMSNGTISIASWNVNSLRRRMKALGWLVAERDPDILCLQETRVKDPLFPKTEIAALGYQHQAFTGMKAHNGVAILSKFPLLDVETKDWRDQDDCRHILASVVTGELLGTLEVHSLYVPAGGNLADPMKNEKFRHKLEFLEEQIHWWEARGSGTNRVLAGDLNITPPISDACPFERVPRAVTHTEIEAIYLEHFRRAGGWADAVCQKNPDYEYGFECCKHTADDWETVKPSPRIDHIWISENLRSAVQTAEVFEGALSWDTPSDHAPIIVTLNAGSPT